MSLVPIGAGVPPTPPAASSFKRASRGREALQLGHTEAGTGFGGKLVVGVDSGGGMLQPEPRHERAQGDTLGGGAGVGGTAVGREAAYVANAYAVGVVPQAVGARLTDGTALLDGAVEQHHVVVAYAIPAALPMPAVDVGGCKVLACSCCAAVEYYFSYLSHFCQLLFLMFLPLYRNVSSTIYLNS